MTVVVFRVDSSKAMGTGHLMRCLTLAEGLRDASVSVSFICRDHPGNLSGLVERRGFPLTRLSMHGGGEPTCEDPAHAAWLGSTWQEDAAETLAIVGALAVRPDWLVVDHYALERRWEDALRESVHRLMVIDDLADRSHGACLLLDQNLVARMDDRYDEVVVPGGIRLLGPCYSLLQPIYAELHDRAVARAGAIERLFVYFGGSDEQNVTGRVLAALLRSRARGIEAHFVVSADDNRAAEICNLAAGYPNIHVHSGLSSLAPLMAEADLAIGACGVTAWERLAVGLPALVITVAENQRAVAEELNRRGLIRYLGHQDEVDDETLADALDLVLERGSDEAWSRNCLMTVDGKGTARVCSVLTTTAMTAVRVRAAEQEDEARLLEWSNDKITRQNAFHPQAISAGTHHAWFKARLGDPEHCRLYVAETPAGIPLGTVRFEREDTAWEVHFSLSPLFRGRGLGRRILEEGLRKFRAESVDAAVIYGRVKENNLSSRRIFESLEFEVQLPTEQAVVLFRRLL